MHNRIKNSSKPLALICMLLLSNFALAQEKTIIQVKVPNKDDVVYIAGNQKSLGNWDYDEVKMFKVSDYYRMIAVKLNYPAEFKFTRGSLDTEGIHKNLKDNPSFVLNDTLNKAAYRINAWKDELLKSQMEIGFQYLPFQSKILEEERTVKVYLPEDYSKDKKYPVFYLTEANATKFKIVSSTLESLSTSPYNAIPKSILVGIEQDKVQLEINTELESSAETFKTFILSELVTLIDSKFSTSGFNTIIGHNMGADFNQMVMMTDYNPIHGYININPNVSDKLRIELTDFIENYDGRKIFNYVAGADYSSPEAKESYKFIDNIHQKEQNKNIDFFSKEYKMGKESLFSASIKDGILHVFNLYRNLNKYSDFMDYALNYPDDMMLTYRVSTALEPSDIEYFTSKIILQKNVESYYDMIKYLENKNSSKDNKPFKYSAIDKAKHYYKMERIDSSLVYWNKALDDYSNKNSNLVNPQDFYSNFTVALDTHLSNSDAAGAKKYLQKCIKSLPQFSLVFHYYIAKLSSDHDLDELSGKSSLSYCVENFKPNIYFTKVDLKDLVYSYDN